MRRALISTALAALLLAGTEHVPSAAPAAAQATVGWQTEGLPVSGRLNEADSKRLFARFGIRSVDEVIVHSPAEAEQAAARIGGNVVLKILVGYGPGGGGIAGVQKAGGLNVL